MTISPPKPDAEDVSGAPSQSRDGIRQSLEDQLRHRFYLNKLWQSILRSLIISTCLLTALLFFVLLVAALFYLVNRHGHTDCERYRQLKALETEYNDTLTDVLQMSRSARVFEDGNLTRKLLRLRQLGQNYAYKNVKYAIGQHELQPDYSLSLYYAVTLVSLIGYGDIAGASELQYFCASLCMLIVVPVWHMYHHQLYHLFYFLQLYCHRRWLRPTAESQSNHTMLMVWTIRIRNAIVYKRSRFYLSNLVLMIILFPLCLAAFAITDHHLSLSDKLWLTLQSIFHIGLGDVPAKSTAYWSVTFVMISTCFLVYFQCFSFILPQYPALRLTRIMQNDFGAMQ